MCHYLTQSDRDTGAFGQALGALLKSGDALLLRGEMGAGKSVLARGVARALGVQGAMPSPTFTLMQPHEGADMPVYHFDLYRLSDADEFFAAGLDEYIDADGVSLIEWPLRELQPLSRVELWIERAECENQRRIRLELGGFEHADELTRKLAAWEAKP